MTASRCGLRPSRIRPQWRATSSVNSPSRRASRLRAWVWFIRVAGTCFSPIAFNNRRAQATRPVSSSTARGCTSGGSLSHACKTTSATRGSSNRPNAASTLPGNSRACSKACSRTSWLARGPTLGRSVRVTATASSRPSSRLATSDCNARRRNSGGRPRVVKFCRATCTPRGSPQAVTNRAASRPAGCAAAFANSGASVGSSSLFRLARADWGRSPVSTRPARRRRHS